MERRPRGPVNLVMIRTNPIPTLTHLVLVATLLVSACGTQQRAPGVAAHDETAFAALQERGRIVMGVDQYTSVHRFDALADGGRIELQRDRDDAEGIATIRAHLKAIAEAFASGDFSNPRVVHAGEVPGTAVMTAKRAQIRYEYRDLPRGGEIRITTSDDAAIRGIHEFMAFQRGDHRAGGHAH